MLSLNCTHDPAKNAANMGYCRWTPILNAKSGETNVSNVFLILYRGRIISVGRALDCRAGGRGFDSRGRTNTQGLKITEK